MQKIFQFIQRSKHLFVTDSLFRNSTFLIASTGIMSVLGFAFWLFIAHLYSPAQIGVASALISITTLLANLSLLGLDAGLVRFLPSAKSQSRDINAAGIVVAGAAIVAACIYLLIGERLGIHISLLSATWEQIGFVVLMIAVTLNSLTDSVFIANRRAGFHTLAYSALASVKLILPILLVSFGSFGIFAAYSAAILVSLVLSIFFMRQTSDYRLTLPNWHLLGETRKYVANNYIGHILSSMTAQLLPVFILQELGTAQVAFFSMAWTMANFLYVIPTAIAQSLLAESSHDPAKKHDHTKHTVRLLILLLIPAVSLAIFIAPYLLTIFGTQYSIGSTATFQVLAAATFFVAANEVSGTILNIDRHSFGIVFAQLATLITTFASAIVLVHFGLVGIGFAFMIGTAVSNVCYVIIFKIHKKRRQDIVQWDRVQERKTIPMNDSVTKNFRAWLQPYNVTNFTIKQFTNGGSSHTFLVTQDTGARKVLRIYGKDKQTREQVQEEINFMEFLRTHGLPVPQLIKNSSQQFMSEFHVGDTTWLYVLMEFEEGAHPEHYTEAVLRAMAASQATIHILSARYVSISTAADNTKAFFKWPVPYGFSHYDFDGSNILIANQKITCILDFEGMRYSPLVVCLFFTLTRIYEDGHDRAELRLYIAAYEKIRRLTMNEKCIINVALALRYKAPSLLFTA